MVEKKAEKKRVPLAGAGFVIPEDPKAEPFLVGAKCTNCNKVFSGMRVICLNCGVQNTLERFPLKGKGKLYTYTVVWQQVPGALVKVPYAIVNVVMDEGCQIQGVVTEDLESLDIEMNMEVYFEKMREDDEGNNELAFKFRPVKKIGEAFSPEEEKS